MNVTKRGNSPVVIVLMATAPLATEAVAKSVIHVMVPEIVFHAMATLLQNIAEDAVSVLLPVNAATALTALKPVRIARG